MSRDGTHVLLMQTAFDVARTVSSTVLLAENGTSAEHVTRLNASGKATRTGIPIGANFLDL